MNYLRLFLVLAAMWASQLALAFMQAKRFSRDLSGLRKSGYVATGMGGRRYRGGRAFVSLAADSSGVIQDGLLLKGFTVFAQSKPLPQYIGFSLEEIISEERDVGSDPKKVTEAAKMAAGLIRDHLARKKSGE